MPPVSFLDSYRLLGRSGLRVSPLALGTMTFGTDWGWGADEETARSIFDMYVGLGGNFVDTANVYTDGSAERLLGNFAQGRRNSLVIATKYSLPPRTNDPNCGGNHRKSMITSVEDSLRRLRADYIDLLYLHLWDFTTPTDEIARAMDDLVRAGKVLYLGISNTPAWQIAKIQVTSTLRGFMPLIALQIEYNLLQRTPERELIPAAQDLGLGIVSYSPLAEGLLSGKYTAADLGTPTQRPPDGSRRNTVLSYGGWSKRCVPIVDAVAKVAHELDRAIPQVAIAWLVQSAAVTSIIIGARTLGQFRDNLQAPYLQFTDAHREQLSAASAVELGYPHDFLAWALKSDFMGRAMNLAGPHRP